MQRVLLRSIIPCPYHFMYENRIITISSTLRIVVCASSFVNIDSPVTYLAICYFKMHRKILCLFIKNFKKSFILISSVTHADGIEPPTHILCGCCSTTETIHGNRTVKPFMACACHNQMCTAYLSLTIHNLTVLSVLYFIGLVFAKHMWLTF